MTAAPIRPALPFPPAAVPLPTRATLLAAASMTVLAGAVVAAALPGIAVAFRDAADAAVFTRVVRGTPGLGALYAATPAHELLAKLVITLPALAVAVFAPVSGWFADRFGRTRLLVGGLTLYVAAGTTGVYLTDPDGVLLGRLGLGVAVAMVMTATTTLVSDYFAGPARAKFLGLQASFMALGGVAFIPLGGVLAQESWHAPFAVYAAAVPMLLMAVLFAPEPARAAANPAAPADGPTRIPVGKVLFVYAVGFAGMLAFYFGPAQVPFHAAARFGLAPQQSGLLLAGMTLASATVGLKYGTIARRFAAPRLVAAMFLLVGAGFTVVGRTDTLWACAVGLVIAGFGAGLLVPTLSTWLLRLAPPRHRGRLSGGLLSAIFLGQFVSPLVAQPFIDAGGTPFAFAAVGLGMLALGLLCAATARE